jgi:hypothetical protein
MKEPVDHILRPRLPWRANAAAITECGYDGSKVKTITREQFHQRLKDYGRQRTAMLTCMTCGETAERHKTWDDDPRRAIEREVIWECAGSQWGNEDRGTQLKDELIAIAALIEAHRSEFDAIIQTNVQRREWLEKKAVFGSRPVPSKPRGL